MRKERRGIKKGMDDYKKMERNVKQANSGCGGEGGI
jgi:hypothetical protein